MLVDLAAELRDCSLLWRVLVNQFIVFLYCNLDLAFEINHKYGSIQSLRWTLNRMLNTVALIERYLKNLQKCQWTWTCSKKKKSFWHYFIWVFIASQKTLFSKYSSFHKSDFFWKIASMTNQFPCWSVYSAVWKSTREFNSKSTINWSARVAKTKLACIPDQCTSNQMVHSSDE